MHKDAVISECGHYRYLLQRSWDSSWQAVCFIMLNPSTADAELDDPTIRRCLGFAKELGYGQLEVVNLFALRATDPAELKKPGDVIGPENDSWIADSARVCSMIICAWGNHGNLHGRSASVLHTLRQAGHVPHALRISKSGQPAHPLYLPYGLKPIAMP